MTGFSHFVLEYTLELAIHAMPPEENPRVANCIQVIRRYLDSSLGEALEYGYDKELRQPVIELMDIALQRRQFSIAARLQDIVRFLGETARSDVA
jgi:hypothetical protein